MPGVSCQICGSRMEPERIADKRRWRFVCPVCGEKAPIRDGRGAAARSALAYDALRRSMRREIRCPYYTRRGNVEISCEAPREARELKLVFDEPREMLLYMARYCRGKYAECVLCRACEEAYKEDPGE